MLQQPVVTLNVEGHASASSSPAATASFPGRKRRSTPGSSGRRRHRPRRCGRRAEGRSWIRIHAQGGKLIACVTGFRSIARVLELPKMNPDLLEEAVTARRNGRCPCRWRTSTCPGSRWTITDGHQRIFALGVPRDILDPLLKAMNAAKRPPYAVDIKPLALARARQPRGSDHRGR